MSYPELRPRFAWLLPSVLLVSGAVLLWAGLFASPPLLDPQATPIVVQSSPRVTPSATLSPSPSPIASATPQVTPTPLPTPPPALVSRVLLPAAGQIDLAVVGADPAAYPLCDVAMYPLPGSLPLSQLGMPGETGKTVYLYAHARYRMFGWLLLSSWENDGRAMLGDQVFVYSADGWKYTYVIDLVKRHARDYSLALAVPAESQWLVMQTSEGDNSDPKLQVRAQLTGPPLKVSLAEANPRPRPRACL